jgi:tetratricopeptide (TPR) repeat protein
MKAAAHVVRAIVSAANDICSEGVRSVSGGSGSAAFDCESLLHNAAFEICSSLSNVDNSSSSSSRSNLLRIRCLLLFAYSDSVNAELHVDLANLYASDPDAISTFTSFANEHSSVAASSPSAAEDGRQFAVAILQLSLRLHGQHFVLLTSLGYYLKAGGHLDAAREVLLQALAVDEALGVYGQLWHAYYHLGDICALLAEHDDAISYLSAAALQAELDGQDAGIARSRLYAVAVDYHHVLRKTPPRSENLVLAFSVIIPHPQ